MNLVSSICVVLRKEVSNKLEASVVDRQLREIQLDTLKSNARWRSTIESSPITPAHMDGRYQYQSELEFEWQGRTLAPTPNEVGGLLDQIRIQGNRKGWTLVSHRQGLDQAVPMEPAARVALPWWEEARSALVLGYHLLLLGPRGTGKTSYIKQLARELELELFATQGHADLQVSDLVGQIHLRDGATYYAEGPLLRAVRTGGLFLLDEANLVRPGVSAFLNAPTSEDGFFSIPDTGEVVSVPATFRAVLCANPNYHGTSHFNEGMVDRFRVISCPYWPQDLERRVVQGKVPHLKPTDLEQIFCVVAAVRQAATDGSINFDFSIRSILQWAQDADRRTQSLLDSFEAVVLPKLAIDPVEARPQQEALRQIARLALSDKRGK